MFDGGIEPCNGPNSCTPGAAQCSRVPCVYADSHRVCSQLCGHGRASPDQAAAPAPGGGRCGAHCCRDQLHHGQARCVAVVCCVWKHPAMAQTVCSGALSVKSSPVLSARVSSWYVAHQQSISAPYSNAISIWYYPCCCFMCWRLLTRSNFVCVCRRTPSLPHTHTHTLSHTLTRALSMYARTPPCVLGRPEALSNAQGAG